MRHKIPSGVLLPGGLLKICGKMSLFRVIAHNLVVC